MAEIRNYTMNFGYGITSAAPKLACAAISRAGARRIVAPNDDLLRPEIHG
jgi:hypothetical protein